MAAPYGCGPPATSSSRRCSIDPSVVDPADIEMLQDLILAALRDVVEQAHAEAAQALGGMDVGGDLGGLLGQ